MSPCGWVCVEENEQRKKEDKKDMSQVYVRTQGGATLSIDYNRGDTWGAVKRRAVHQVGGRPDDYELVFQGDWVPEVASVEASAAAGEIDVHLVRKTPVVTTTTPAATAAAAAYAPSGFAAMESKRAHKKRTAPPLTLENLTSYTCDDIVQQGIPLAELLPLAIEVGFDRETAESMTVADLCTVINGMLAQPGVLGERKGRKTGSIVTMTTTTTRPATTRIPAATREGEGGEEDKALTFDIPDFDSAGCPRLKRRGITLQQLARFQTDLPPMPEERWETYCERIAEHRRALERQRRGGPSLWSAREVW